MRKDFMIDDEENTVDYDALFNDLYALLVRFWEENRK